MIHPPIDALIPHKPPLRLVDAVISSDDDGICCSAHIGADNVFLRQGRVRAVVCIEYMAQTIAAFSGLRRRSHTRPRIGYLLAATQLTLAVDALHEGDALSIVAKRVWGDDALGKFECVVSRAGASIASGSLSVYMPPDTAALGGVVP